MTTRDDVRISPPQKVFDAYKEIRDSALILNKTLNEKTIAEFQVSLNKAQSNNEDERNMRSLIQYLYRRNPTNFCQFLIRSRLSHLILWTEAKCIVLHFGLRSIVYIKWNNNEYECSLHKNISNLSEDNDQEHPSIQKIYQSIGNNFGNYNNQNRSDRYNQRRPRDNNNRDIDNNYRDRNQRGSTGASREWFNLRDKSFKLLELSKKTNNFQRPENTESNFPVLQSSTEVAENNSQSSNSYENNTPEVSNLSASTLETNNKGSYSQALQSSETKEE